MPLLEQLRAKRAEIYALLTPYGISNVRVFGSVARGEERPDSDIDLLVHLELNGRSGLEFVRAHREVQNYLGRKVDLVTDKGLHHLLRDGILSEAQPL